MSIRNGITANEPYGSDGNELSGSGHIIIRLAPPRTHDHENLRKVADKERFTALAAFLDANPQLPTRRLIRHASPSEIREREAAAADSRFAPTASLTNYWRIDARGEDNAEAQRKVLHAMPEVAVAYHETSVREACAGVVGATANPYILKQGYLEPAPEGIGARTAWQEAFCDGSGINAIDLETGWILDHQDLPKPKLVYGDNGLDDGYASGDHGAATMGVIGGVNNDIGIIGVAPNIATLCAVSHYDLALGTGLHVADAISAAITHLSCGDILLLEVQRHDGNYGYPTEIDSADRNAIQLAVANGIVVIAAAGNGDRDLDAWVDPAGEHVLNTADPGHIDSGAVMVGSGKSSVMTDPGGFQGHKRYYTSNYGSRVNVYAWGENVCTAGYGQLAGVSGAYNSYTANFGQTSAAAAIMAGAAALVQSWYRNVHGDSLSSADMRDILSNPATATSQVLVNSEPVGVMPDVHAIVTSTT